MSETAKTLMSVAEFLDWNDGTDTRYELLAGEPRAMAPPSEAHARIVGNGSLALGRRLARPCAVLVEVGVPAPDRGDTFYVADLLVTCAEAVPGRRHPVEPVLIVEVLSPSTADHDRGLKLADYRRIDSLQDIVLVSSTEKRAEHWRRVQDGWLVQDLIGDGLVRLQALGFDLPLAELYADVALGESEAGV